MNSQYREPSSIPSLPKNQPVKASEPTFSDVIGEVQNLVTSLFSTLHDLIAIRRNLVTMHSEPNNLNSSEKENPEYLDSVDQPILLQLYYCQVECDLLVTKINKEISLIQKGIGLKS